MFVAENEVDASHACPVNPPLVMRAGPYRKEYPRGKKTAAGHPPCGWTTPQMAVWWVARPQVVEALGMAGRSETLGSPWILLPLQEAWEWPVFYHIGHPTPYAYTSNRLSDRPAPTLFAILWGKWRVQ
jgi:hypothetical protein